MGKTYKHLCVSKEVHNKVLNECVKVFIKDNPEFKGANITHNHIINRMADYYLTGGKLQ